MSTCKSIRLLGLLLVVMFISASCSKDEIKDAGKATYPIDGPYVIHNYNSTKIIQIGANGELQCKEYAVGSEPKELKVFSQIGKHQFSIVLSPNNTPSSPTTTSNNKIFVLSDPHGDFDSFVSILRAGKVINENYQWTYNKNHMVVIGDAFDRGVDVLPIFWLCYKLNQEATAAGGQFHFIIGNHEDMVLSGNYKYAEAKYTKLAGILKMDYKNLFAAKTELGAWIRSRNFIEVIGRHLFVHAGISKCLLDKHLLLEAINQTMRGSLGLGKENIQEPNTKFLFDSNGPLWYRGMVKNDASYEAFDQSTLAALRTQFNVDDVIVGHTIFDEIKSQHNGQVVPINVDNSKNRSLNIARAIIIEGNTFSTINDKGEINPLK